MTESQPGWGKLSEGQPYLPFAFDVGRAIFALGLGENVGSLLWHVLEVSWGSTPKVPGEWSDPVPCPLDCGELAGRWGVHRNRLYEAKRWLIRARILKEVAGGVVVNKKVDSWVDPKGGQGPLLSPKALAYAEAGKARTRGRPPLDGSNVGPLQIDGPSNVGPLLEGDASNVGPLQKQRWTVAGHIEERAPGFEKEKKAKAAAESSGDAAAASPPEPSRDRSPGKPAYPDERTLTQPGAFDPTLDESRLLFDQLWEAYHSRGLCLEWWVARRQYDIRAWRHGLATLQERGTTIRRVSYLSSVAADWPGDSPSPARTSAKPRYRETGPPPPPYRPPLSPERIAEHKRGEQLAAERNGASAKVIRRPQQTAEEAAQAISVLRARVASSDEFRATRQPLTGT